MIIRVEKRKRFTIISNVPIEDARLSWEALGVLCWLLSKPDGWRRSGRRFLNRKGERVATRQGGSLPSYKRPTICFEESDSVKTVDLIGFRWFSRKIR